MRLTYNILVCLVYPRMKGKLRLSSIDLCTSQIAQSLVVLEVGRADNEPLRETLKQDDNVFAGVAFHHFDQRTGYSVVWNL